MLPVSDEDEVHRFVDLTLPFHCELDEQLRIVRAGKSLDKVARCDLVGELFADHFICDSLHGTLTADILRAAVDSLFIARHRGTDVLLRGQIVEPAEGRGFIIAWAPWFTSLEAFQKQGLTLADFGIMDPIVDVLHLLQAFERAADEAAVPNRRMERFFSLAPDLMLISDPEGSLTLVNPAVSRMLGYSPSVFMADPLPHYVHPDDRATYHEMFSMLTRGLPAVDVNLRLLTASGGWRSTRWTALADLQENLIYATARDVSASVEARELSNRILATSPNAIMTIDAKGKITYANPEVTRLFGYSHDELVGNKIEMLIPTEVRTKHPALRDRFVNAELGEIYDVAGVSRDVIGQTASGQRIPVQITLTKITTEGKTQTLASVVDISGRKMLETELLAARDAAVTLARAKTDFIANTSHEIRTPLTAVIALTELLLATPLNDEQRDLVTTSQAASERLLSLINNVLTFSKSEAGKMEDEVVVFRPAELAADCVQIITPAATAIGLEVNLTTAPDLPEMVEGDREKLRSILLNITGNAVKFTERGSVNVTVTAGPNTDIVFQIADTGVGFDPSTTRDLFQPFVQADASTTRRFGGSGLGLAICKQLADEIGGRIEVTSELGVGSVFTVTVPLTPFTGAVKAEPTAPAQTDDAALESLRVLLVEDDAVNSLVIARMLTKLGAVVARAANGSEALKWLESHSPDVVLMDCYMPVMDGFRATEALREREGDGDHVPVIALTASALQEDADRCVQAGMDAIMSKPVRLANLATGLARFVQRTEESASPVESAQ